MPRSSVPLYADGDFVKLAELRRNVAIAERNVQLAEEKASTLRFGDEDSPDAKAADLQAAEDAYDEFIDEAAERAEEWIVESIGHEEWRKLLADHPPRKVPAAGTDGGEVDHPEDAGWGFNVETFGKALLLFVDPEDPEHRTIQKAGDIDLGRLALRVRRLSAGQFESLWAVAYQLNSGGITDPKLGRFSPAVERSDET